MRINYKMILLVGVIGVAFSFYLYGSHGCGSDVRGSDDFNPDYLVCMETEGETAQDNAVGLSIFSMILIVLGVWQMRRANAPTEPGQRTGRSGGYAILGIFAVVFTAIASLLALSNQKEKQTRDKIRQQGAVNQVRRQTKMSQQSHPRPQQQQANARGVTNKSDEAWRLKREWEETQRQRKFDNDDRAAAQEARNEGND